MTRSVLAIPMLAFLACDQSGAPISMLSGISVVVTDIPSSSQHHTPSRHSVTLEVEAGCSSVAPLTATLNGRALDLAPNGGLSPGMEPFCASHLVTWKFTDEERASLGPDATIVLRGRGEFLEFTIPGLLDSPPPTGPATVQAGTTARFTVEQGPGMDPAQPVSVLLTGLETGEELALDAKADVRSIPVDFPNETPTGRVVVELSQRFGALVSCQPAMRAGCSGMRQPQTLTAEVLVTPSAVPEADW